MSPRTSPAPFRGWVLKARSFKRLSGLEQCWFAPVWCLLGLSRFALLFLPFQRIAPLLGSPIGNHAFVPTLAPAAEATAHALGRTVRLAARYTPWRSTCLAQAIVARLLLGAHGVPFAIHLGMARTRAGRTLRAHAWVSAGRCAVTGGHAFEHYTVLGAFIAPGLLSGAARG